MSRAVLFLCVANSARSQLAEALGRALLPEDVPVLSAGSAPSRVNPLAVQVLAELGLDASEQRSKSVQEIDAAAVATVVTLCAEEVCPLFLGPAERLHWPLPDPAASTGTAAEQLAAFRSVRDDLRTRLETFARDRLGGARRNPGTPLGGLPAGPPSA